MNKIFIFPTDTVYGIGTPISNKLGVLKIAEIKGRDFNKPLAVLCSSLDQMNQYAYITDDAIKLVREFWPGALTIVLKAKDSYTKIYNETTIGIRMPNHPLALSLVRQYGPLKTTSMNHSGDTPLNDYELIVKTYGELVDDIYPNDFRSSSLSSTVIDLSTTPYRILREGDVSLHEISKVIQM